MRSTQTCWVFFLAIASVGLPELKSEEVPPVNLDLRYVSKYVVRGVEIAGPSAQTEVQFAADGFRGGLSTNQAFKAGSARTADLGGAYDWQAGNGLLLEASARALWSNGGAARDDRHSFELGIAATFAPLAGVTPGLAYYHDLRLRADTLQASLAYSWPLTRLGAFLDFTVLAGSSTGDDWRPDAPGSGRRDGYTYWGAEARLPYRFGRYSTLVAGLGYTGETGWSPTNGPFGLSGGQNLWASLGVNLDF